MAVVTQTTGMTLEQAIEKILGGDSTGIPKELFRQAVDSIKGGASTGITVKVDPLSGVVAVYGLGKSPVSLYSQQWARVLAKADAIRAACASEAASKGKDDPRYALYRNASADERARMRKALKDTRTTN